LEHNTRTEALCKW